jgi:hypothetical protein
MLNRLSARLFENSAAGTSSYRTRSAFCNLTFVKTAPNYDISQATPVCRPAPASLVCGQVPLFRPALQQECTILKQNPSLLDQFIGGMCELRKVGLAIGVALDD